MTDSSKSKTIDLKTQYAEYYRDEISQGVPPSNVPQFDEFVEMHEYMSNPDTALKFVTPGKVPSAAAGAFAAARANPFIRKMVDAGVDSVSKEGQRIAENIASRLASGTPFVKVMKDFGDTGGSSGGGAGGSGSPGNPFSPNRMNFNPKPVQVRLDTGIRPKGYGEYYPVSNTKLNVVEATSVVLGVPTSLGTKLKEYFDSVIAFNFQNDAQMRVSFNIDAVNNFTSAKLTEWLNAYSNAYAKYVFYTTVINYCNEPLQQNEGMKALREMITPSLLDDLSQLANMLDGTPAPPKWREWIHFIYGAPFKTSSNPGAQIRMIIPTVLLQVEEGGSYYLGSLPTTDIRVAINDLFAVRETTALIAKCCPQWIPGRDATPAGASVTEYSPNWHTLFENLPYHVVFENGTEILGPVVETENEDGVYGSTADTLDGAITAHWNAFVNASGSVGITDLAPGTFIPMPNLQTTSSGNIVSSRISCKLISINGVTRNVFTPNQAMNNEKRQYGRCETYTVTSGKEVQKLIWPGREQINNINVASSRQTAYEFYSKVFDMGTVTNKSFDRKGSKRRMKKADSDED